MPLPAGILWVGPTLPTGYEVGATLYLDGDMGDYFEGHSVTVPDGTPGKLVEFFGAEPDGWGMARIEIPGSPGQKVLTTRMEDLPNIWSLLPPHKRRDPPRLFDEGDKVEDPETGSVGFVRALRRGRRAYDYEIEWTGPKRHEGLYKHEVVATFIRILSGWNRLTAPDDF